MADGEVAVERLPLLSSGTGYMFLSMDYFVPQICFFNEKAVLLHTKEDSSVCPLDGQEPVGLLKGL
ncbi:hypothetical protein [Prevotella denticola]|uniref:hypothetical protein n=1 Tax=Prevotella denticola TaxID=28129 RepID=UPI0028E802F0|nr:hypothetical protein [Prevotella denticola]